MHVVNEDLKNVTSFVSHNYFRLHFFPYLCRTIMQILSGTHFIQLWCRHHIHFFVNLYCFILFLYTIKKATAFLKVLSMFVNCLLIIFSSHIEVNSQNFRLLQNWSNVTASFTFYGHDFVSYHNTQRM